MFFFIFISQSCFVFSLVKFKPLTYNKVYEYPDWSIGLGWTLALASMICIPMVMVIKILQSEGPLIEVQYYYYCYCYGYRHHHQQVHSHSCCYHPQQFTNIVTFTTTTNANTASATTTNSSQTQLLLPPPPTVH